MQGYQSEANIRSILALSETIKLFKGMLVSKWTQLAMRNPHMRLFKSISALLLLIFAVASTTWAAPPINTLEKKGFFGYEHNGIAIRGYDTVAYFTQSKPVKGSDKFTTEWQGATWKFSSQEHLDLFLGNPEQYTPQYGGYCAYGIAQEALVKIEPDLWTIYEGKLYLNYNKKLNNEWKKDIPGYIAAADKLFEKLLAEQ